MYEKKELTFRMPYGWTTTHTTAYLNGTVYTGTNSSNNLRTTYKATNYRKGSENPQFRQQISEGRSATTPFDACKYSAPAEVSPFLIDVTVWKKGSTNPKVTRDIHSTGHSGLGYLSVPPVPNWDIGPTLNRAAIKIRKKIDEQQNKFAGLTFLGELRESIAMLRKPGKALQDYAANFGKKNFAKVEALKRAKAKAESPKSRRRESRALRDVTSDLWLEFAMGWSPLASDVVGILDVINSKHLRTSRLTSWHEDTDVLRETFPDATTLPGVASDSTVAKVSIERIRTRTTRVRYIVGFTSQQTQIPTTALEKLREYGGFTPSAAILALYDLTPYSFLVDYFSTLGDVLQANLTSMDGVNWVNQTVHRTEEISVKAKSIVVAGDATLLATRAFVPGEFKTSVTRVERGAGSIPFGYPTFQLPHSTRQFLNLAALANLRFFNFKL